MTVCWELLSIRNLLGHGDWGPLVTWPSGLDTVGVLMKLSKVWVWSHCEFALICLGSEFIWECLCVGESRRWQSVVCRRVALVCASGDRRENVVCVCGVVCRGA